MADQHARKRVRAEHQLLRGMAPADRAVALLSAIVEAENDTFGQVLSLLDALIVLAKFLDQNEREFVANRMVDNDTIQLILRWH
jgi:hypothetical protein